MSVRYSTYQSSAKHSRVEKVLTMKGILRLKVIHLNYILTFEWQSSIVQILAMKGMLLLIQLIRDTCLPSFPPLSPSVNVVDAE